MTFFFPLKITIFTAVKYCCILHGHVCIMPSEDSVVHNPYNNILFELINHIRTYDFKMLTAKTINRQSYSLLRTHFEIVIFTQVAVDL